MCIAEQEPQFQGIVVNLETHGLAKISVDLGRGSCHLQCDCSSLWLVLRREFSPKRADVGTAPSSQGKVQLYPPPVWDSRIVSPALCVKNVFK